MTGSTSPTFRVMLGSTTRLEASPQEWAAWMDVLSPTAFKALVLLAEPVPSEFDASSGWHERLLCQRGMALADAADGVQELGAQGYLAHQPLTSSRQLPAPQPPRPRQPPALRCTVCRGFRWGESAESVTYAIERSGYLKIGTTTNLHARLEILGSKRPGVVLPSGFDHRRKLNLVGTMQMSEHDVHERLAEHHVIGEWFADTPAVRSSLRDFAGLS